jgi:hypothetical protein
MHSDSSRGLPGTACVARRRRKVRLGDQGDWERGLTFLNSPSYRRNTTLSVRRRGPLLMEIRYKPLVTG